jgi:hypothetical protein
MFFAKAFFFLLIAAPFAAAQFLAVASNGQPGFSATPGPVQQTVCSSSGSSYTCTLGSTASTSNVLTAIVGNINGATNTTSTVSSSGATWALKAVEAVAANGGDIEIWCATLSGSPGTAITITQNASYALTYANVSEWSGQTCTSDPVGNAGARATSTTPSPGAGQVATSPVLVIAAYSMTPTGSSLVSGPSNGFTAFSVPSGSGNVSFQAAWLLAPAGTYTTGWTVSASNSWVSVMKGMAQ